MAEVARRLCIFGRVQGVAYRAWTVETAQALGLKGWVRNRRDGSVEALFVGDSTAVTRMEQACRRGPPAARVDRIDAVEATEEIGSVAGFRQLPTL